MGSFSKMLVERFSINVSFSVDLEKTCSSVASDNCKSKLAQTTGDVKVSFADFQLLYSSNMALNVTSHLNVVKRESFYVHTLFHLLVVSSSMRNAPFFQWPPQSPLEEHI